MKRTTAFLGLSVLVILLAAVLSTAAPQATATSPGKQWFKGNTHTHTLWSDGNAAPELVADWYASHGYQFLVLSDHNILSNVEGWRRIADDGRNPLTPDRVDAIRKQFGDEWVTERTEDDMRLMKLKTLDELRLRFEKPGEFLFIEGEELTDGFEKIPVHVNGLNVVELIPPQGGSSVRDTMQRNIDAVIEQGKRLDRPVLAHVNHPNFGWALTVDDIAAIKGERYFEIYNGHPGVRNYGDDAHLSTERMWDIALTLRLMEPDGEILYGLATDDAHHYHNWGVGRVNPGRGWVMVHAERLEPDLIINAMHAGDFYASTGVTLKSITRDEKSLTVTIDAEPETTYTTQFIGTRRGATGSDAIGVVLAETSANPAVYEFRGDELYVRAKVISSKLHPNPYAEGDHQTAWTQPALPPAPRRSGG